MGDGFRIRVCFTRPPLFILASPLKSNNMKNTEVSQFWVKMFRPRGEKWQKQQLSYLRNMQPDNPFYDEQENAEKIKALEYLLN